MRAVFSDGEAETHEANHWRCAVSVKVIGTPLFGAAAPGLNRHCRKSAHCGVIQYRIADALRHVRAAHAVAGHIDIQHANPVARTAPRTRLRGILGTRRVNGDRFRVGNRHHARMTGHRWSFDWRHFLHSLVVAAAVSFPRHTSGLISGSGGGGAALPPGGAGVPPAPLIVAITTACGIWKDHLAVARALS